MTRTAGCVQLHAVEQQRTSWLSTVSTLHVQQLSGEAR